jgi:two-component system, NarL family, nitrate/nitrite response regulator NarL
MTDTSAIRICIADDHPLFREGVVRTLSESEALLVVGEAGDAEGAVRIAAAERPDLILLDVSMPGGGLAALTQIMKMDAPPKVVMLTVAEDDDVVLGALKAGAVGYILKGVGSRELVAIIRDIADGQSYLSPSLAMKLLNQMQSTGGNSRNAEPINDLSKREEDILKLVAKGLSNREVGDALDLQEKTVKHYMTSILQKLHVRNRTEAALVARQKWTE